MARRRDFVSSSSSKGRFKKVKPFYATNYGQMLNVTIEEAMAAEPLRTARGQVNLIFTSPPFPLIEKKKYGNLNGEDYLSWIAEIASQLADFLAPDGSFVIEIGNAWERGNAVMSTLPVETLLAIAKRTDLHLCQQFICHNPARLPGPAQWVNIERVRVKDSFTQVWWFGKSPKPKADNRNVLVPYGEDMKKLLKRKSYNAGARPSGHVIGEETFFKNNGGAIPASVLEYSNTAWSAAYREWCKQTDVSPHPARMSPGLAEFFVKFLTDPDDLVLDPFGGSNTTGAVAEEQRRRWLAVEPDADYVLGSMGRFPELIEKRKRIRKRA